MTIDDEVRRAAQLLEALIQAVGMSQEEVEQRLEASPGYLGRLLSGRVELKLRHILAVLRALEIEPSLFFSTLYPEAGPESGTVRLDELRQRLETLGLEIGPVPGSEAEPDLESLVQRAVQAALSRREPES